MCATTLGSKSAATVSVDYDPMLGKLIVHGATRDAALDRLGRALSEYEISGVRTTLPLFRGLLADPEFRRAAFDTQWLDRWLAAGRLSRAQAGPSADEVLLAAAGLARLDGSSVPASESCGSRWRETARREALRRR